MPTRKIPQDSAVSPPSSFSDRRVVVAIALLCCLLWGSAVPAVKTGYSLLGIVPADTPSLLLFAGLMTVIAVRMLAQRGDDAVQPLPDCRPVRCGWS